jgi:hypothetical protein
LAAGGLVGLALAFLIEIWPEGDKMRRTNLKPDANAT